MVISTTKRQMRSQLGGPAVLLWAGGLAQRTKEMPEHAPTARATWCLFPADTIGLGGEDRFLRKIQNVKFARTWGSPYKYENYFQTKHLPEAKVKQSNGNCSVSQYQSPGKLFQMHPPTSALRRHFGLDMKSRKWIFTKQTPNLGV